MPQIRQLRTRNIRALEPNTSNQQFAGVKEYFTWFKSLPPDLQEALDTTRATKARELLAIINNRGNG